MRRFLFSLLIALVCFPVLAETVSQKEAQRLAHLFFNESAGRITAPPKLVYNGRKLTTNRLFTPFYVYNTPIGGFVIISAENKAFPILGFSLKESFDPDKLGETDLALLKSYATEIELVRYDSQSVEGVEWAWQHYAEYVESILKAKYVATDPKITIDQCMELIWEAIELDNAIYSDIYTPAQWRDMLLDELELKESAPLGLIAGNSVYPAVVYGHQGDYFRIELSSRNGWLMRINATDVIPSNMATIVVNPLELPIEFEIEQPFVDHDAFLAEVEEIESVRMEKASIDFPQFEDQPMIKANGGGHFEIQIPENVVSARIYNLAGALVRRHAYGDTQIAHIDISAEPSGFYFVTLEGNSGKPYGIKLYR